MVGQSTPSGWGRTSDAGELPPVQLELPEHTHHGDAAHHAQQLSRILHEERPLVQLHVSVHAAVAIADDEARGLLSRAHRRLLAVAARRFDRLLEHRHQHLATAPLRQRQQVLVLLVQHQRVRFGIEQKLHAANERLPLPRLVARSATNGDPVHSHAQTMRARTSRALQESAVSANERMTRGESQFRAIHIATVVSLVGVAVSQHEFRGFIYFLPHELGH